MYVKRRGFTLCKAKAFCIVFEREAEIRIIKFSYKILFSAFFPTFAPHRISNYENFFSHSDYYASNVFNQNNFLFHYIFCLFCV